MNKTIETRIDKIRNSKVPDGYIKTSFGIFPADWELDKRLCEIGTFKKGKGIPGDKMQSQGMPCIGYGDIYMKFNYYFEKAKSFVDIKTAQESQKVNKGAILFTGTGETAIEIGKCVCYNGDEDLYVGGDIIIFNPFKVNSLFLAYQQYIFFAIKQKARLGQGNSVVHIYIDDVKRLNCAYPKSQAEQKKIAEILMTQDRLIQLKEQLIEEKKKQKKYLMDVLLTGKIRLLGFTGEWNYEYFQNIVSECNDGGTPCRNVEEYFLGEINWVVTEDIKRFITSTKEKLTGDAVKKTGLKIWPEETVILSTCATIGEVGILKCQATTKQGITAIVVNDENYNEFVRYWLQLNNKILNIYAQGSSIREIRVDKLMRIKIKCPKKKEQKAIAEVLSRADDEIELLQKELEEQKRLKQSLMQLLLTGIVRVNV